MNRMLLCAPALIPIIGGLVILLAGQLKTSNKHGNPFSNYRNLEIYVEVLTVLNSLIFAWLIFNSQESDSLVLFKLFGDLNVMFRLDGLGRVFAGLISFLWPLAVLYSFEYMRHEERRPAFFAYYLMTYGVTAGIVLSGNLITMYLFYELLTLVTFPLVLHPMSKEAQKASRMYLYYSIGGAAFAFISIVLVLKFSATGTLDFIPGGVLDLQRAEQWRNVLNVIFLFGFFGFGVKAAVFPLHAWLPKAAVAPTPVTALLHAVAVVKSGAFAIMRLTYYSFGTEFLKGSWAQWVMMTAAMVTIVYGSTVAVKEAHWKRRLAQSTISNLSYIVLGASMMNPLGLVAALSHMIFHGVMKISAFFCAGAVMHQTGKTHVYELDGLGRKMPVTFACLTVSSLSLTGIPLFAGFISKWNIANAGFASAAESGKMGFMGILAVAVLLYSAAMTAIYMMTVVVRAYFPKLLPGGRENPSVETENAKDPNWLMLVPLVIFSIVIIYFGIHSQPLMGFLTKIGGEVR